MIVNFEVFICASVMLVRHFRHSLFIVEDKSRIDFLGTEWYVGR